MKARAISYSVLSLVLLCATRLLAQSDPLPSWNDGPSESAITSFVARVTKEGSPDFVKPEDRIACFDNDGTLWCEQPMYFQLLFALDRVKASRQSIRSGRIRNRSPHCSREM